MHSCEALTFDVGLAERYYQIIMENEKYDMFDKMLSESFPKHIPVSILLGMADASSPCYLWADFINGLHRINKLTNVDYFIATNTGHLVSIDEEKSFSNKTKNFSSNVSFFKKEAVVLRNSTVDDFINSCTGKMQSAI